MRVYEKSRRIGISWSTAAEAALVAAAASGMDVWYIGYNKDMAEEFIRDSADWIGHYQLVAEAVSEEILNDGDKDILTFVIRCASGYRITALSSRPLQPARQTGLRHHRRGCFPRAARRAFESGDGAAHVGRQGCHHQHARRRR